MTELESKALNESIRLNERLEALKNNEDFKEIILNGFIESTIKGSMMALPYAATDDSKKRLHSNLEAIAKLEAYFLTIENQAKAAKATLEEDATIQEDDE